MRFVVQLFVLVMTLCNTFFLLCEVCALGVLLVGQRPVRSSSGTCAMQCFLRADVIAGRRSLTCWTVVRCWSLRTRYAMLLDTPFRRRLSLHLSYPGAAGHGQVSLHDMATRTIFWFFLYLGEVFQPTTGWCGLFAPKCEHGMWAMQVLDLHVYDHAQLKG